MTKRYCAQTLKTAQKTSVYITAAVCNTTEQDRGRTSIAQTIILRWKQVKRGYYNNGLRIYSATSTSNTNNTITDKNMNAAPEQPSQAGHSSHRPSTYERNALQGTMSYYLALTVPSTHATRNSGGTHLETETRLLLPPCSGSACRRTARKMRVQRHPASKTCRTAQ